MLPLRLRFSSRRESSTWVSLNAMQKNRYMKKKDTYAQNSFKIYAHTSFGNIKSFAGRSGVSSNISELDVNLEYDNQSKTAFEPQPSEFDSITKGIGAENIFKRHENFPI